MKKIKVALIVSGILFLFLMGFLMIFDKKVNMVNSETFESLLSSDDVFVVNAHTPYVGEINGTDLIAENWMDMEFYLSSLPEDKDTRILIYCRSGRMSNIAAKQLIEMGYSNVYDLEGGMKSWVVSGRDLIGV